ncbi:hypothetical protein [Streptomyces sp. NRRL B-24720]|uniref:hypothetical protein n=1 Tax=Streptomyces sp. NRRL B-24720 TaxID=1476876 RepID=UPI0004C63586|nr:hypothetical protein [Streptomyces sp. NRRL B-24720]
MTTTATAADRLRIGAELAAFIASVSEWDKALIEQAIEIFGEDGRPFSMNTFRDLLPEMAHHTAGLVFLSMVNRKPPPIVEIRKVRSTSRDTHHKEIGEYVLAAFANTQRRAA